VQISDENLHRVRLVLDEGLTRRELRDTCHIRNTTLGETLTTLHAAGRVRLEDGRVQLALL